MAIYMTLVFIIAGLFCFEGRGFAEERPGPAGGRTIQFDDLQLAITQNPDNRYLLNFSRQGRFIYSGECAFRVREPKIVADIPAARCRSLLAHCFSGGAHCCMSLMVVSSCGSQRAFNVIDLGHSASEVKFIDAAPGIKAIKVTDWQFAYYGAEDSDLQLSFADSPGLSRLLVFENGRWRADRIGEFSRFYLPLHKEADHAARRAGGRKGGSEEVAAGMAIKVAYYGIMSGGTMGESAAELTRVLPQSWKRDSDKIIDDIRRAASDFNPVEVIE